MLNSLQKANRTFAVKLAFIGMEDVKRL